MNNNYKIIRTIFENVIQRVLECSDNDTCEIFYNNVITSQEVICLINIDGLNSLYSNIINCYKTEDRIFIITKSLETQGLSMKEYVDNNKLSMKQQFDLSKKVIELSSNIFNMTDVVQQKILDLDKVYVDENSNVMVDCNLIFEEAYDIQDNETLKRMGNMLHYIFSGSEINDYNISELVPPDILKIIVRCLTKEYRHPSGALEELLKSPIYNMISPENSKENKLKQDNVIIPVCSNKLDDQSAVIKATIEEDNLENKEIAFKENESVLNIYLNDKSDSEEENTNKSVKRYLTGKDFKKTGISIILVVFVLIVGRYLINRFNNDAEKVIGKNTEVVQPSEDGDSSSNLDDNDGNSTDVGDDSSNVTDSTSKFFNKELLERVGYTGTVAEIDNNIYVEGQKSLVVKNEGEEKVKALFVAIDFTDENYNYMLKKQIGISAKTKSENDVSALIVLEAYKDGKIASTFHTTIQIYNDMWSQNVVPINVTNADSLNIYIEYSGKNKVWIDEIYIDVVK